MDTTKMPPEEKVYEAWTAIADGRVALHDDYATMTSSDGSKEYTIKWVGNVYVSDDNASYWRGYPGYPVLAVLMLQGKLPFNREEAEKWKDVNWKAVNTKNKNNYASAVKEVASERHIDMNTAEKSAREVMSVLATLGIVIKRSLPKNVDNSHI